MQKKALPALGIALAAVAAIGTTTWIAAPATAKPTSTAPVMSLNITEAEVLEAQQAWVAALVQISKDHEQGGAAQAKATAERVLDSAYGYNLGPVLFKPTLAAAPQTFRTTRDGALAYFVGGNPTFAQDSGFALKGWRSGEMVNHAIHLHGTMAVAQGNVTLVDKAGKATTVDKTFGYVRDNQGALRIVLHHSSLPFGS